MNFAIAGPRPPVRYVFAMYSASASAAAPAGEPISSSLGSVVASLRRTSYVSVAPGASRVCVVGSGIVVLLVELVAAWARRTRTVGAGVLPRRGSGPPARAAPA